MIHIISPAKTLDLDPISCEGTTLPRMQKETMSLVRTLKKYKPKKLGELMHISDSLALLNTDRYQAFSKEYTIENSKTAVHSFKGGVYLGLEVEDFTSSELDFCQQNLRILSGLYGLLKPLDLMQPYRLEMSTKLPIRKHTNLYQYWGDKITKLLQKDIDASGSDTLINLASQEYFKAINLKKLKANIITIHFKEYRDGKLKFISFNAKKARGLMSRYIIKNSITQAEDLKGFNYEGYFFSESDSTEKDWMFVK